jgi:23S rRNA (adenine2030-N6)-methyltransferase
MGTKLFLRSYLPPTRRGLVFVDPPFESPHEFELSADGLNSGIRKWPTGIFLAWYPIKDRAGINKLRKRYASRKAPTLVCEFLRDPPDGVALAGSGLIISNPPWQFEKKLTALCRELLQPFEALKGTFSLDWWAREREHESGA